MNGDTSVHQSSEVSVNANSTKIHRLLNKEILCQKDTSSQTSLSLSPSFSLSEPQGKEEISEKDDTKKEKKEIKKKRRIRKKTTKRIDVLSESPIKNCKIERKERESSDDLGTITWGSPTKKSDLETHQQKNDIEKELQSLLHVSKNRQQENSNSSFYQDSNTSIAIFESEISLTQQIQSFQEMSSQLPSSELVLLKSNEMVPPVRCQAFVESSDKDASGFDSIVDSSLLEEVDRIEAEECMTQSQHGKEGSVQCSSQQSGVGLVSQHVSGQVVSGQVVSGQVVSGQVVSGQSIPPPSIPPASIPPSLPSLPPSSLPSIPPQNNPPQSQQPIISDSDLFTLADDLEAI